MTLPLDTRILLWAFGQPERLSAATRKPLRLLLAQATSEGITLLTGDAQLARYPGPVRV